jgi:tape measure domain-containing protein
MSLGHAVGDLKVFLGLDVTGFQKGAKSAEQSMLNLDKRARSLGNAITGFLSAYALQRVGRSLLEIGLLNQQIDVSMKAVIGTYKEAAEDISYVRTESERLGLVYTAQILDFRLLTAAAQGTALAGKDVRDVFTALGTMGTVLQLPADTISGAVYAIQQMISKGTVQSEELRGQLGERLPGAFQIAARAMKMTTAELSDFMAEGKLMADEFIPAFSAEVMNMLGKDVPAAAKMAQSELNRLSNLIYDIGSSIASSEVMREFARAIQDVNIAVREWYFANEDVIQQNIVKAIDNIRWAFRELGDVIKTLNELPDGPFDFFQRVLSGGAIGMLVGNPALGAFAGAIYDLVQRIKEFQKELEETNPELKNFTGEIEKQIHGLFGLEWQIEKIQQRLKSPFHFRSDEEELKSLQSRLETLKITLDNIYNADSKSDPDRDRFFGMKEAKGRVGSSYMAAVESQAKAEKLREKELKRLKKLADERQKELDRIRKMNDDYWNALASSYGPYKEDPDRERLNGLKEAETRVKALYEASQRLQTLMTVMGQADEDYVSGNWILALKQGADEYGDSIKDTFTQIKEIGVNAFKSLEDTMVNFFMTGKLEAADFFRSIAEDMARLMVRQNITGPLAQLAGTGLSMLFSSSDGYRGAGTRGVLPGSPNWHANGGIITEPIVGRGLRTGRTHVFGEDGDELITPLSGNRGGGSSGGSNVQVIVNNHSNQPATINETQTGDGMRQIMVTIGNDIRRMGPVGQAIGSRFGLSARGIA